MARAEHLAKLEEDVETWNAWRRQNLSIVPDLNGANLRGVGLRGVDLRPITFPYVVLEMFSSGVHSSAIDVKS